MNKFIWPLTKATLKWQKHSLQIAKEPSNIDFYRAKVRTTEIYFKRMFPRIKSLEKTMMANPESLMRITSEQF